MFSIFSVSVQKYVFLAENCAYLDFSLVTPMKVIDSIKYDCAYTMYPYCSKFIGNAIGHGLIEKMRYRIWKAIATNVAQKIVCNVSDQQKLRQRSGRSIEYIGDCMI